MALRLYGNGNIENVDSIVTSASATLHHSELAHLDGVTSSLQSQINTKAPIQSPNLIDPTLSDGTRAKLFFEDGRITENLDNSFGTGRRTNLGSIPWGSLTGTYVHIKLNITRYSSAMIGFDLYGYGYSAKCIVSHMVVYTFNGQSTPYQPTYVNLGNSGGFANPYYSSGTENLVLVINKQGSSYVGGILQHWAVHNNTGPYPEMLAMAGSNSTSGVY